MSRSRVLVAVLVVAVVGGIVALQAVDSADSRTPITPTTTSPSAPTSAPSSGSDRGSLRAAATPTPDQCAVLEAVVPAVPQAIFGGSDFTPAQRRAFVRDLRRLARSELIASDVKPALRKLARFFAQDLSVLDLGEALTRVTGALVTVAQYSAQACGDVAIPTTTTSGPRLR